jgi:dephospho-CoA kinase
MLNLRKGLNKVAVTGGLSCGKSSVCHLFQELGCFVISADEIVHELLSTDMDIIQEVVKLLGRDIFINNQIDREIIAKKVFIQPHLLKSLENILHPAVQKEIKKQYKIEESRGKAPLFIAEIPLLFETGADSFFDFTVTVAADVEICKKRFIHNTLYDQSEFEKRQLRQLSVQEKIKKADYVIENNGTLIDLKHAVKNLYQRIININSSRE